MSATLTSEGLPKAELANQIEKITQQFNNLFPDSGRISQNEVTWICGQLQAIDLEPTPSLLFNIRGKRGSYKSYPPRIHAWEKAQKREARKNERAVNRALAPENNTEFMSKKDGYKLMGEISNLGRMLDSALWRINQLEQRLPPMSITPRSGFADPARYTRGDSFPGRPGYFMGTSYPYPPRNPGEFFSTHFNPPTVGRFSDFNPEIAWQTIMALIMARRINPMVMNFPNMPAFLRNMPMDRDNWRFVRRIASGETETDYLVVQARCLESMDSTLAWGNAVLNLDADGKVEGVSHSGHKLDIVQMREALAFIHNNIMAVG